MLLKRCSYAAHYLHVLESESVALFRLQILGAFLVGLLQVFDLGLDEKRAKKMHKVLYI
jgi:hypothetical protein